MLNMKEEKITISVNQEDVQNIINCYEKDIEKIEQLQEETEALKEKVKGMQEEGDYLFNKLSIENKSLQSQLKAKEEVVTKLKEWLEEMLNELKQNDVYDRTSYEMGQIIVTECIITKIEELEKIQELEILSKGENKWKKDL